jgi:hypothetical protein
VNYTMYKIDSGSYAKYTAPIVYNETGAHTITYYSVDNAGNIEDEQSQPFNVPIMTVTIKGGLGISVSIANNGTATTNINWRITVSGLTFPKLSEGTLPSVAPGTAKTVKASVFGIGPTKITVTVNGYDKTARGFVLLAFVLGVK